MHIVQTQRLVEICYFVSAVSVFISNSCHLAEALSVRGCI